MKLFLKYFIKYLEIIMQKDAKNDKKHHFSELFYDFSWVIYGSFFMKNHPKSMIFDEISPNIAKICLKSRKIDDFSPKFHENR